MPVLSQFSKFAENSDYLLDLPKRVRTFFVIIIWISLPLLTNHKMLGL